MPHIIQTMNFKSNCPKCGGRKKIRTKVSFHKGDAFFAKSKCYKCGYWKPATWACGKAIRTTWTPPEPAEQDDNEVALAVAA